MTEVTIARAIPSPANQAATASTATMTIATTHTKRPVPEAFDRFVGHASSAFADEIMTRIYIDEIFGGAFPEDPASDEHVAELLAFTRHRMLFGIDPDPALLKARSALERLADAARPNPAA